jgi:hypothetical protein
LPEDTPPEASLRVRRRHIAAQKRLSRTYGATFDAHPLPLQRVNDLEFAPQVCFERKMEIPRQYNQS